MTDKRVKGYPFDTVKKRKELVLKTYEYDLPFNYPNVTVWRKEYDGGEFHGIELLTTNSPSPKAQLTRVAPGEWTRMQTSFIVPPETASAQFRLDVADMSPDETLWIADAFAGVVADDWNPHDDIPSGTANRIANPAFGGGLIPPAGWKMDTAGIGSITPVATDSAGHAGLELRGVQISLYTEFPVQPGQRLVYSLWAKSTNPRPKTVWLYPAWKDKQGRGLSDVAGDCIIIEEEFPIVRVAVIGSACTPPGYVMLEAEPCDQFYGRGDFVRCTAPVRFRQNNLWGMHLRADQWGTQVPVDFGYEAIPAGMIRRYPGMKNWNVKAQSPEFPFTGMSCAVFEIPKSEKVIIQGGSEVPVWLTDNAPNDDHYSFRTIRTTVAAERRPGGGTRGGSS